MENGIQILTFIHHISSYLDLHATFSGLNQWLMGEIPCSSYALSFPSSCSAVAPYAADINTQIAGSVQYTDFYTYSSTDSAMTTISSFIRDETEDNFYGSRMMVAEWNGVAEFDEPFVSHIYETQLTEEQSLNKGSMCVCIIIS